MSNGKAVYCAPRAGEIILDVVKHDTKANTVDLAREDGTIVVTGCPLVADSVAGCAVKGAFARPHITSADKAEAKAAEAAAAAAAAEADSKATKKKGKDTPPADAPADAPPVEGSTVGEGEGVGGF